ncbi:TBC domain containing protein [Musa troglodytarum]|uniref:TBC domain containing protein n=1 Tax=Musa troglodytarum TaxID=320322 RepID=A0A9E7JQB5_9LILI|nr:TBC domain containing protein [Musa troglodytarum]
MFGTQAQKEASNGFALRRRAYWLTSATSTAGATTITSIPKKPSTLSVKFEDMYGFTAEGNIDDVNVLNEVRERVREQGRVWCGLEASKGANWYLQTQISSNGEGISVASLKLSKLTNTITLKRLVRKGIPPVLRPNVWLSVSGAAKKRSTVPESYYDDLIRATEGKVTPATRQIDHDLPRTFPSHPWLDSPEGQASLRRVLVGYSFRDSDVGYCQYYFIYPNVHDLIAVHFALTFRIAAHLEAMEFDVSLVATEWFLCLFAKSVPSETTLRVWDILFNEGAKVLFHVALAIFKVAFDKIGSMTANTITKERKKQEPAVMAELDQRQRRLNTLNTNG